MRSKSMPVHRPDNAPLNSQTRHVMRETLKPTVRGLAAFPSTGFSNTRKKQWNTRAWRWVWRPCEAARVGNRFGATIPMYNIKRGPSPGTLYHPKGRGNGYVLTYGGKRFYFSGGTDNIPEMRALKNIYVAFVCMNLRTPCRRTRRPKG